MTPEDPRQRASERFDEVGNPQDVPMMEASEDWEAWMSIATHLQSAEVVTLPDDFAAQVQLAIRRARLWSDLLLVLKVGSVTALVLTLVVGSVLGLDWWQRLSAAAEPANLGALLHSSIARAGMLISALVPLFRISERTLPLVPVFLIAIAIVALAAELAVFRFFHLGPFRGKAPLTSTEL